MTITVAHPASASRVTGNWQYWIYADDDQDQYRRISGLLGVCGPRLLTPGKFEAQVTAQRSNFVCWVDSCLERSAQEEWLTTPLYKNPLNNRLFLHFCWLQVLSEHLGKNRDDNILVVTDSVGLAGAIQEFCRERKVPYAVHGLALMQTAWSLSVLRRCLGLMADLGTILGRMALTRLILGPGYGNRLAGIDVLIDTYVLDQDLDRQGRFKNRYFPGLSGWCEKQGLAYAWYPFFYGISARNAVRIYRRFRRSDAKFAPFEFFARIPDIGWAVGKLLSAVFAPRRLQSGTAQITNMGPIVRWQRPLSAMQALTPLVMSRIPRRLAARGIRPRWMIEWYENQTYDKATVIGFNSAQPQCNVVAVRQFPPMGNFLSLYTTSAEVRARVSPSINGVCGSAHVSLMSAYDTLGAYFAVPALRYSHVWDTASEYPAAGTALLILLPYSTADTAQVLSCFIPVIDRVAPLFDRIIVKPHHTVSLPTITRYMKKRWPNARTGNIEFSSALVKSLLARSRIVVSAQSSAMLEAVCMGVPVVVVGQVAGITINPVENLDRRLWRLVYDSGEFAQAVEEWSPRHPLSAPERFAIGNLIRAVHFEPANETTMRAFLPGLEAIPKTG